MTGAKDRPNGPKFVREDVFKMRCADCSAFTIGTIKDCQIWIDSHMGTCPKEK